MKPSSACPCNGTIAEFRFWQQIFCIPRYQRRCHTPGLEQHHPAQLRCRSSSVPSVSALLDSAVEGALFGHSAEPKQATPASSPQARAGCLSGSSGRGQEVEAAEASAEHTPPGQARPALSDQVSQTCSDVRSQALTALSSEASQQLSARGDAAPRRNSPSAGHSPKASEPAACASISADADHPLLYSITLLHDHLPGSELVSGRLRQQQPLRVHLSLWADIVYLQLEASTAPAAEVTDYLSQALPTPPASPVSEGHQASRLNLCDHSPEHSILCACESPAASAVIPAQTATYREAHQLMSQVLHRAASFVTPALQELLHADALRNPAALLEAAKQHIPV